MPWFAEFDGKYRSSGLAVIGVSMDDEGWAIVTPYLEAHPTGYPIVLGDHDVADRYGVASLPVTLLIDRERQGRREALRRRGQGRLRERNPKAPAGARQEEEIDRARQGRHSKLPAASMSPAPL